MKIEGSLFFSDHPAGWAFQKESLNAQALGVVVNLLPLNDLWTFAISLLKSPNVLLVSLYH